MMQLTVQEFMSLDGVVQAPSYPDEDTSDGFTHGGWNVAYMDEESMRWVVEGVERANAFLFGRGTFEIFAAHWPNAPPTEAPPILAEPLNSRPKLVASRTLREPLSWAHSKLLKGDIVKAVLDEKRAESGTLLCIGSPGLVKTLLDADLVDQLRLMINPLLLGSGKQAFPEGGPERRFELKATQATKSGAILATYARA